MIVFGIDPGLTATGYGVVEKSGSRITPLEWGVIRSGKGELPERLEKLYSHLIETLNRFKPDLVAVESIFLARDPKAALLIGHARGIALLAAVQNGAKVVEYPVNTVKQAVVGKGHAAKEQVRYMVGRLLSMDMDKVAEDASDALAVAVSGCLKNG